MATKKTKQLTGEQLITAAEVARRLKISRTYFYMVLGKLLDRGLKRVRMGSRWKYLQSSFDRMIERAAENGRPLY